MTHFFYKAVMDRILIVFIGRYALLLSIILSIITLLIRKDGMLNIKRINFFCSLSLIVISYIFLLISFINSDFSVKIIFSTTSTLMPPLYKIAASWGSHEGSMLLWLSLLSVISILYMVFFAKNTTNHLLQTQIDIIAFTISLFGLFIFCISSPFTTTEFIPNQGVGLNPVLQDFALLIHPPLLYLGYVTYIIPFIVGLSILARGKGLQDVIASSHNISPITNTRIQNFFCKNKDYLAQAKLFSSIALFFLTFGIALGSWWAYRELGWGGYWFFDPVENISLIPWICGIVLHHLLIITIKTNKYYRFTIIMSCACFLTTLYGFIFVRSGIISSVHSFAFSEEKGLYLSVICGIITLLVIVIFSSRQKYLPINHSARNAEHKTMLIGNILLLVSAISLVISIIYPIYCLFISAEEVAITPEYFYKIFIPVYIPILLLAAVTFEIRNFKQIFIGIFSLLCTIILRLYLNMGIISFFISFASVFLMLQMCSYLIISGKNKYQTKNISLFMGHFGLGLLVFSITINTIMTKEIEFIGKIGDVLRQDGFVIKLQNIKYADHPSYYRQIVEFLIEEKNGNIITLKPENRLYKIEQSLSQETDIFSFITHDLYAVLNQIDGNIIHAMIFYNPMISFIWLACALIACGFVIRLY